MLNKLREFDIAFWNWMRHSGTIAWARLQVFANSILAVLVVTDVSAVPYFRDHPEFLVYWNVISGVISEYIRRRGTETVTTEQYVPSMDRTVEVTKLVDTNAVPPTPKG